MKRIAITKFTLVKPYKFVARKGIIKSIPKGFVLLKPIVASICKSEILYFKGEKEEEKIKKRLPMCLLHEGVAKIVAVGQHVDLNVGTHVVVNPMIPCGKCVGCKSEVGYSLCQKSKYMASTTDGLSQTLLLYPSKKVIAIPKEVELEVAALAEPLSIALKAFEVANPLKDDNIAVIGDGAIGYLLTLISSHLGKIPIDSLYFFGIINEKLLIAKDFSTIVNSARQEDSLHKLKEKFDIAFEVAGGQNQSLTINQSIELLKPAGKCIVLGLGKKKIEIDINKIVNKGLLLRGSTRSEMKHFIKILDLMKDSSFKSKVKRIISKRKFVIRTPEDLEQAFRYADTEDGYGRTIPGRSIVYLFQDGPN